MNLGFWDKLKRPIMVLAPMADVTDAAFRRIIAKYGKPDVLWTEFVAADGLVHPTGRERLLKDLQFDKSERPVVAQLFTSHPEKLEEAAAVIQELGFDGLDINMGCPDRSIEKQGAGAALMKKPELARELICAAKRGAPKLPISVKTRVGYNKDELDNWLPEILAEEPAVVTVHARTRKEMSKVPARWGDVTRAVKIRSNLKSKTLIFGNGDLADLADAYQKASETGADGVMFGRAIFGNPWLFVSKQVPVSEKLQVMLEHTKLFEKLLGGVKSFAVMKKHYKAYVHGFPGATELRAKLMATQNAGEVEQIVNNFLKNGSI